MDLSTFIVSVFCLIADHLKGRRIRRRGPAPKLSDSEVLTIEVVGEFLGLDTDRALHRYFRRHYGEWFPALCEVHRTTFLRQAANLWAIKESLWRHLLDEIRFDPAISLVDSFPVPVCRFAGAYRCRLFSGEAAFGYDEMAKQKFYGLRAHLRVCWPGVICDLSLAPANIHDLHPAEELLEGAKGWALGDRSYRSSKLAERLEEEGLRLLAPHGSSGKGRTLWLRFLVHKRRRIETVIGQLVGRYDAKKMWARDRWHLTSRWLRKVLSHTVAVHLCQQAGLSPLRFSDLLTD